jgi:hypothetical protein
VVIDWDLGRDAIVEIGYPALKPGLQAVNSIREAKPGKDTTSLGRFIKVSPEYFSSTAKINLVHVGWRSEHGRIYSS